MRHTRMLAGLFALGLVGCDNGVSPEPPAIGKTVVLGSESLAQTHAMLSEAFKGGTLDKVEIQAVLASIRASRPTQLFDYCRLPGKKEDLGTQRGVRTIVYTTGCGSLYFEFHDSLGSYMLGPGGWAVFKASPAPAPRIPVVELSPAFD